VTHPELLRALKESAADAFIREQSELALLRTVAVTSDEGDVNSELRLIRLGFMHETRAFASILSDADPKAAEALFAEAFRCWSSLASQKGVPQIAALIDGELPEPHLTGELSFALHLAVSGVMASKPAEVRLSLQWFKLEEPNAPVSWERHVAGHIARALVLLTRKGNGWADVERAASSVRTLRGVQKDFEAQWLDEQGKPNAQQNGALRLIALYHLAQIVTLLAEYLTNGSGGSPKLVGAIERHYENARKAALAARAGQVLDFANLLRFGATKLALNSIWHHVAGIGKGVEAFAKQLMARGRERPLFEMWPAQQEALGSRLLDPYPRAILVEMPTSAGKTLLAEFSIVQTHALAAGTIVYVVPTRALVNQVTRDLRSNLGPLGLKIEQAVPAFEMDPSEEKLLGVEQDVLVTTPEKLDLLFRKDHPVTKEIALVVADEAHCIADGTRGARLELVLGMVKRERPEARFLLLSPFVPGSDELLTWLGGNRTVPPIRVDWRPSRRIVGALCVTGRKPNRQLTFETLKAADNVDVSPGRVVALGKYHSESDQPTLKGIVRNGVNAFRSRGGILVLCKGPGTTVTRANELSKHAPKVELTPELQAARHYVMAELGEDSSLATCLEHGVAYHHAGLSHETRWLIEGLIRRRQVSIICGTTTLAQGVNFPISTVLVETLKKGKNAKLSYADFWNIAGRAGRALMDSTGVVAFPIHEAAKRLECDVFLRNEAREVASQLANIVSRLDSIGDEFSLRTVASVPELSGFLQFLAHAMRVAGSDGHAATIDDVEELLRASLYYHQEKARHGEEVLRRLVQLCRSYLTKIKGYSQATLSLADMTGFATPSVMAVLARTKEMPSLRNGGEWAPGSIFGADLDPLTRRIEAIADLPEIRLGSEDAGPFNARRVAAILRDWVTGKSLGQMAEKYRLSGDESSHEERVCKFSKYLFSDLTGRASWGLGALEGVCLAGKDPEAVKDAAHVPSMVFFGVRERESIWMRMVGAPRMVAPGLGKLWQSQGRSEPESFDALRRWVSNLSDSDLKRVLPKKSRLVVDDLRVIWREISGEAERVAVK
jgi:replicative superfamily II helicase